MIMSFPIFFFSLLPLLLEPSHCTSIIVDGSSEWKKNPAVQIGDSIIFKHKQHHSIYIFQNKKAFDICNFAQATVTNPNTTFYTWHPSRPGFFYFSFNDGSVKACHASQKLAIKVTSATAPSPPQATAVLPELPPMAAPASSPRVQVSSISSPPLPWPFRPHQADSPVAVPLAPDKGGGGMPFINSNPAIPLPAGEVDSATIHPLPISGHEQQVMIGSFGFLMALHSITLLL